MSAKPSLSPNVTIAFLGQKVRIQPASWSSPSNFQATIAHQYVHMDPYLVQNVARLFQDAEPVITVIRVPRVGDRVAIPNHAVVFYVTRVNDGNKTVSAEVAINNPRIEENIPWNSLTFID
jgi:hypothetical protein